MGNVTRWILRILILLGFLWGLTPATAEQWMDSPSLTDDQLAAASGRQGVSMQWQINDTEQNASVADNMLSGNVVTGNNYLSDSAFGQMSGIATVIQNTGNQVVIQDSTQINILINQ